MPGFFNQQNTTRRIIQVANIAGAAVAAYDLATNPESHYSEVGLDLAVHAQAIYLLRNDNNAGGDIANLLFNTLRLGTLYSALTTGCTSVPTLLNVLDTGIHAMTGFTALFLRTEVNESTATAENRSPSR